MDLVLVIVTVLGGLIVVAHPASPAVGDILAARGEESDNN